FDPQAGHSGPRQFFQHRGVAYWQSQKGDDRILFGTFDGRLIALNAKTGKPCPDFGKDGGINLRTAVADAYPGAEYSVTSPPAVYQDLVITGAAVPEYPAKGPSGVVRAFNVRSGQLVWTFHTIPQPAEPGHETWQDDAWEDRRVPESNVPGEAAWPTQPFPLKPPPLVRQSFGEADISDVTKESHQYCAELAHSLKTRGMYTPYGLELTLVMPGTLGGGNWSGA